MLERIEHGKGRGDAPKLYSLRRKPVKRRHVERGGRRYVGPIQGVGLASCHAELNQMDERHLHVWFQQNNAYYSDHGLVRRALWRLSQAQRTNDVKELFSLYLHGPGKVPLDHASKALILILCQSTKPASKSQISREVGEECTWRC